MSSIWQGRTSSWEERFKKVEYFIPKQSWFENFSIVLIYKEQFIDKKRRINLDKSVNFYLENFPGIEIVVVEQFDETPTFNDQRVNKVNLQACGPYRRAESLNLGMDKASSKVVLLCDNDFLIEKNTVLSCLELIKEYDFVKPFLELNKQKEGHTVNDVNFENLQQYEKGGYWSPLGGGALFCRKEVFERIGGYDESFAGWGGEDDVFTIKATLCTNPVVYKGKCIHLYHTHALSYVESKEHAANNARLVERVKNMSADLFKNYMESQVKIYQVKYKLSN